MQAWGVSVWGGKAQFDMPQCQSWRVGLEVKFGTCFPSSLNSTGKFFAFLSKQDKKQIDHEQ